MDAKKRIKFLLLAGGAVALLIVVGGVSCKMGAPNYTITVVLADGVAGSPATGQYVFKELTTINFSYQGTNALHTVEVFLNDKYRYSASGAFVLYGDGYKLTANLIDLRGDWDVKMTQITPVTNPVVTYTFTITIAGPDLLNGTFSDTQGHHGTWKAESGILILTYTDWVDFVLSGGVYTPAGTYLGNSTSGTWTSTKKT
jgi:hypothetical protein